MNKRIGRSCFSTALTRELRVKTTESYIEDSQKPGGVNEGRPVWLDGFVPEKSPVVIEPERPKNRLQTAAIKLGKMIGAITKDYRESGLYGGSGIIDGITGGSSRTPKGDMFEFDKQQFANGTHESQIQPKDTLPTPPEAA